MEKLRTKRRLLSVFSLVMINVIAVDSLRTLPISAEYGFSLLFYYGLATICFFIPTLLVTAELATGWPNTGGVYIWVREAFGLPWAFLTIWLQWIYNVVWYPTAFSFIAATLAYLINPHLVESKLYMIAMILGLFWLVTFINSLGMKASSMVSNWGAIIGTLIPMVLIIGLGAHWLWRGMPSQIHFDRQSFLPDLSNLNNLAFLVAIVFGLIGMEMSATHAEEVRNPSRDYPKALIISAVIILATLTLASLAIAIVVPHQQLSLVTGLLDAFAIFFAAFHLAWALPIIIVLIALGSLSGVAAWLIGPAKGLWVALQDNNILRRAHRLNRYQAPASILFLQGIIVTALCILFSFMPTVNSFYWILTALTAQLGMLFYILVFAAAIRLRYKKPHVKRAYRIPGGKIGVWITCSLGITTCVIALCLGFLPPSQIPMGNVWWYEAILGIGMVLLCAPAYLLKVKHVRS